MLTVNGLCLICLHMQLLDGSDTYYYPLTRCVMSTTGVSSSEGVEDTSMSSDATPAMEATTKSSSSVCSSNRRCSSNKVCSSNRICSSSRGGAEWQNIVKQKRLALKNIHLHTLREVLLLSKTNCPMEADEKVKRLRRCLLILGKRIEIIAAESEYVLENLWQYVHAVCRTQLSGKQLGSIYKRLAEGEEAQDK